MKTAGEEDPNSHVRLHTEPSPWDGKSEPSSLIDTGWKVRKYPAAGEVFFLTFPVIELHWTWQIIWKRLPWRGIFARTHDLFWTFRVLGAEDRLLHTRRPSRPLELRQ